MTDLPVMIPATNPGPYRGDLLGVCWAADGYRQCPAKVETPVGLCNYHFEKYRED